MADAVPRIGITHLQSARIALALSLVGLWVDYIGAGGNATASQFGRWLDGTDQMPPGDYDIVAQALNDAYTGLGQDHPIPYADTF